MARLKVEATYVIRGNLVILNGLYVNQIKRFHVKWKIKITYLLRSFFLWAGRAQSVWRLATDWTVRGSNPVGGEIFRTRPDGPWDPLSLL